MITTEGRRHIKRYLAGMTGGVARSISFGLGTRAEDINDSYLQFETVRADIILSTYDYTTDKLIFKAAIPSGFTGVINEVGLWSLGTNTVAGNYASRVITTFDSNTEFWTTGIYNATNSRIGSDSLRIAPAASTTQTAALNEISLDLSRYSSADKFLIAYYSGNTFAANFKVRLKTDNANYYELTKSAPANGYNVIEIIKGAATAVGAPSWGTINSLEVEVTSTAGGASQVDFDGIRIEDVDTLNPDYLLVSREVLDSPIVKAIARQQEVEFSLGVNI